jgi:hypothetical protein
MSDVFVQLFPRNFFCYSLPMRKYFIYFFNCFKIVRVFLAFVFRRMSPWDREGIGYWQFISENCHLEGTFRDNYYSEEFDILRRGNPFCTSYATPCSPLGRYVKRVRFCGKCSEDRQVLIHVQPEHLSRETQLGAVYTILTQ